MKENIKKFRIGHRSAKITGVISVVTNVTYRDDPSNSTGLHIIEYGASFCSPTEPRYLKSYGYELAEERLHTTNGLYTGEFLVKHLYHGDIMLKVMLSLALDPKIPDWAVVFINEIISESTFLLYP